MRFLIRLLGGIWLATLVVFVGFAYLEVREERARQIQDLQRRARARGSGEDPADLGEMAAPQLLRARGVARLHELDEPAVGAVRSPPPAHRRAPASDTWCKASRRTPATRCSSASSLV